MVDIWLLFCIGVIFLIIICHAIVDNAIYNDMIQECNRKKQQNNRIKQNKETFKGVIEINDIKKEEEIGSVAHENKLWFTLMKNSNNRGDEISNKDDLISESPIIKNISIHDDSDEDFESHMVNTGKEPNPQNIIAPKKKEPISHDHKMICFDSPEKNNYKWNKSNGEMCPTEPLNPTISRRQLLPNDSTSAPWKPRQQLLPTDDATSAPWKPSGKQALRASKISILFIVTMFNVFYWGYIVEG